MSGFTIKCEKCENVQPIKLGEKLTNITVSAPQPESAVIHCLVCGNLKGIFQEEID